MEYFVTHRYEYDGKTFTNVRPSMESRYKSWNESQPIDVVVLPEHPEKSGLLGDSLASNFSFAMTLGSITLGVGAIALIVIAIVFR